MQLMGATTGTKLPQLQTLRVVPLVLGCRIRPRLTLSAGEVNDNTGLTLFRHRLLYNAGKGTSAYRLAPLPDSKTQSDLQGYRIN